MKNLKQIIVLLFIISLITPLSAYSEEEISLLFEKGLDAVVNGDFHNALSYFDQVLEQDPENIRALSNKAGILIEMERLDDANSVLDKALVLDPINKVMLNKKAFILYNQEKFEESETYYIKILEINPDGVYALSMLSEVLINLERIDQADELLNKALLINPEYPLALSLKSKILIDKGEMSAAFQYLEKLPRIQFSPLSKSALENIDLKYQRVKGLMELKINDSHGNLVGYLQTSTIRILNHEITDVFFDRWISENETIIDGIRYEILRFENDFTASKKVWTGRTGIGFTPGSTDVQSLGFIFDHWIVYSSHQLFVVEEGDVIKITFTVLRPIV